MLTADVAIAVDARTLWDRLDLLLEILSIEEAIDAIQQQYGLRPDLEDIRERQQRVRVVVLAQLRALLDAAHTDTVH